MPEIFNIVDKKSANIIILNAMAEVCIEEDIMKTFKILPEGGKSVAEIQVLVNGVEVPFAKCFAEACQNLLNGYNEHVKKKKGKRNAFTNKTL